MTTPIAPIIGPILDLASQIARWIDEGLDDSEIRKRLADPTGVAADLLRKARERADIGRDLLGRDPR